MFVIITLLLAAACLLPGQSEMQKSAAHFGICERD